MVNSDFLSALHFSNNLTSIEVSTLVDERLADLQKEQRRLLRLPSKEISEGQRFAIRYTLSQISAAVTFLKGEGKGNSDVDDQTALSTTFFWFKNNSFA